MFPGAAKGLRQRYPQVTQEAVDALLTPSDSRRFTPAELKIATRLIVGLAGPVDVPLLRSELARAKAQGLDPEWLYRAVARDRPHLPRYEDVAPALPRPQDCLDRHGRLQDTEASVNVIDLDARRYKPRPAGPAQSVEVVLIPEETSPSPSRGALV